MEPENSTKKDTSVSPEVKAFARILIVAGIFFIISYVCYDNSNTQYVFVFLGCLSVLISIIILIIKGQKHRKERKEIKKQSNTVNEKAICFINKTVKQNKQKTG
ncbi:MAG: hypothetical protein NTW62_03290 [Candidatus Nomurabacteria bacterium]|nr:hypothetical protein [Candidatus Nomurabacteria bacterium]